MSDQQDVLRTTPGLRLGDRVVVEYINSKKV